MSNSLFAALGLLVPMHRLFRRFSGSTPSATRAGASQSYRPVELPASVLTDAGCSARVRAASRNRSRSAIPLRVVRVMEAGQALGGRMVISGRMADVCAELDRMAEREATLRTSA